MRQFYYDEELRFPIYINADMVVSVEPDRADENYTLIKLVNGHVTVYGSLDDVLFRLFESEGNTNG